MTIPWDVRSTRTRSLALWLRPGAVGIAAGLGSLVLDETLGVHAPVEIALHALLVTCIAGGLALRDRDRLRLAWDATHDALTGLLNRRGLFERAEVRRALERTGEPLAVVLVDLDHFKRHNDLHGHAVGDRLLVALGRALASTRPTDLAARLGGDEFVLVMPRACEAEVEAALARVRAHFARDARVLGVEATFSAGVRIADPSMTMEALLEDSDRAMYAAKRAGRRPAPASGPRRVRRWVSFGALLALWPTLAAPASAQDVMEDRAAMIVVKPPAPPPPAPVPFHVELLGGTLAPIDFELAARIVILEHLIVGVAAGLTMYGGVAGQLVDENGGSGAGAMVAAMSLGAFTFRAYGGFRPFDGLGLELVGGYTLITQSASVEVGGIARAFGAQTIAGDGHAAFTLHAATIELAWSFYVLDDFILRPAIGYLQVLDADVALSSPDTTGGLEAAGRSLESAITQYGMTPTVSLSLGYRF